MSHTAVPDSPSSSVPEARVPEWNFYLPDEDRNAGWTNHCYVLQFVCWGHGPTPEQAWGEAVAAGRIPSGYIVEEPPTVAIRADHELPIALAA